MWKMIVGVRTSKRKRVSQAALIKLLRQSCLPQIFVSTFSSHYQPNMTTEKTLSLDPSEIVKDNDGQSDQFQDVYVQDASNDIYEEGSVDPVYQAKARLLNAAIQEIGMGRYQVRALCLNQCSCS